MSETTNANSDNATTQSQTNFQVQRLYVKEQTCKVPHAPQIFAETWKPEIGLEMQIKHEAIGDDLYSVILQLNVTGKLEQRTAFTVEVQQAGVFTISGFEPNAVEQLLKAYCPGVLYPYACRVVSAAVVEASFPALNLVPINFDALYQQQTAQQANKAEKSKSASSYAAIDAATTVQ